MPAPENVSIYLQPNTPPQEPVTPAAVAPAWHTLLLVASIVALSIHSASRFSAAHGPLNRLHTYGFTAAMEVGMLAGSRWDCA